VYDVRIENWTWVRHQPHVRLTEPDVKAIRGRLMADPALTYPALAQEYGVATSTIAHLFIGHTWAWVK